VPPNAHPASAPAPTPAAAAATEPQENFRRFGPYDHIQIIDQGVNGEQVIGYHADGRAVELGTFKDVQTENAGAPGEYVWVLL
jgi:hypothetical protein